ncbi:MAG: hypothetical protein Q8R00_03875 [Candidatus Nanoarchaeia archaeon]|nr:hypothetical protein [Candidatus Nanoarchaeia archaeon]
MTGDYILLPKQTPNGRPMVKCVKCGKIKEHHARGHCNWCFRKYLWTPKKITCKECGRERNHKAYGLCGGCHVRLKHYDNVLRYNAKKYHNIELEYYREITKKCDNCNFSKIVNIHHLDGNTRNNDRKNVVGLCPNCHKMIHMYKYFEEIKESLAEKGFDVSMVHPSNYVNHRK